MSLSVIIEQIKRRARLEHNGDIAKAADEYFSDHPQSWQDYLDEVVGVNKRIAENRERESILKTLAYRAEEIAERLGLDLSKPADLAVAQEKALAQDHELSKRYKAAFTVHVGKFSLTK